MKEYEDNKVARIQLRAGVFFFRERLIYFNFTCDISGTIAGMLLYRLGSKD